MERTLKKVNSISDSLSKYDYLIKKDSDNDFIELTRWQNGEGVNISFAERTIALTDGQIEAIYHLLKELEYE